MTGGRKTGDMPISEAARNVVEHATAVAKLEVELRALELKKKAASFAIGIGLGVGAAMVAFFALAFALATIAAAFATFLPWWLALLVVTLILLCLCGLLAWLATRAFKKASAS